MNGGRISITYFLISSYSASSSSIIAAAYSMDYVECNDNDSLPEKIEQYLSWDRGCIMVCNIAEENVTI